MPPPGQPASSTQPEAGPATGRARSVHRQAKRAKALAGKWEAAAGLRPCQPRWIVIRQLLPRGLAYAGGARVVVLRRAVARAAANAAHRSEFECVSGVQEPLLLRAAGAAARDGHAARIAGRAGARREADEQQQHLSRGMDDALETAGTPAQPRLDATCTGDTISRTNCSCIAACWPQRAGREQQARRVYF